VLQAVVTGFVTGLSLIVAIGAQNAYVLRQGIARRQTATVVAICAVSDVLLIVAGVGGVGLVVAQHPDVLLVFRIAGAAYLLWFAFQSFRSAARATGLRAATDGTGGRGVVVTALALTFLNPHVYLDTVLMLGNLANQQGALRGGSPPVRRGERGVGSPPGASVAGLPRPCSDARRCGGSSTSRSAARCSRSRRCCSSPT
jgi:L-lysine exporter family protein LysE/ArgO